MPKSSSLRSFLSLFAVLFLGAGVLAGTKLIGNNQDIRSRAATPNGVAEVYFEPNYGRYKIGDLITSKIYFNPANVAMSGVAVRIRYLTSSIPEISVEDIVINPEIGNSSNWACPIKQSYQQGDEMFIDIACANLTSSGFNSSTDTLLAELKLRVNETPELNPLTLRFDPAESIITSKETGGDILAIPTNNANYEIKTNEKSCELRLSNQLLFMQTGDQRDLIVVNIEGDDPSSINFESSNKNIVYANPSTIRGKTDRTVLYTPANASSGHANIKVSAMQGNNVMCTATATVQVTAPTPTQ